MNIPNRLVSDNRIGICREGIAPLVGVFFILPAGFIALDILVRHGVECRAHVLLLAVGDRVDPLGNEGSPFASPDPGVC